MRTWYLLQYFSKLPVGLISFACPEYEVFFWQYGVVYHVLKE